MQLQCKAAQSIWGKDALALRTFSGKLAPGKATKQEPRKQLMPAKVAVVYCEYFYTELIAAIPVVRAYFFACLEHWGRINNEDTKLAAAGVLRTLSDKIQDVKQELRVGKEEA